MNTSTGMKLTTHRAFTMLDRKARELTGLKDAFHGVRISPSFNSEKNKLEQALNYTFYAERILKSMRDDIAVALCELK